jgi:hypothetical protein
MKSHHKENPMTINKIGLMILVVTALAATPVRAEETGNVPVRQCPMDGYTVHAKCPLCGMNMEEKELSASETKEAIVKSQEMLKRKWA